MRLFRKMLATEVSIKVDSLLSESNTAYSTTQQA